jgi:serine/threonine-protein kinase RsbW
METLTLPARIDTLETFLGFVLTRAAQAGASEELLADVRLGVEEILSNIFFYAYPDAEGRVEVGFSEREDGSFSIRFTDWGIPFDPMAYDAPDLEREFSAREMGGMGIYLARNLADQMVYERLGDANQLTVSFPLKPRP